MSRHHFAGLDVSVKETAICILDPQGRVVHRAFLESDPKVIRKRLLAAREALGEQLARLHKMLLDTVRTDPVCRRLMTAPGVGPVVALTYRACVDNPARFSRSRCVGAHCGLRPRLYQSGETARMGRISRCGDALMRAALHEAALVLLTSPHGRWISLKAWGMGVARRRGMQKAVVAVARKLAVVLHAMWRDGTDFRWSAARTA